MTRIVRNITIQLMSEDDIAEVHKIELLSFSLPWSKKVWLDELMNSQITNYLTAKLDNNLVVGYVGFWLVNDEAMIVNIAVHPDYRKEKIGEKLLRSILELAGKKGAKLCTLEVRISNSPAIKLYEKYGFQIIAIRKGYYRDNNEDAYVMWLNPIPNQLQDLKIKD